MVRADFYWSERLVSSNPGARHSRIQGNEPAVQGLRIGSLFGWLNFVFSGEKGLCPSPSCFSGSSVSSETAE